MLQMTKAEAEHYKDEVRAEYNKQVQKFEMENAIAESRV